MPAPNEAPSVSTFTTFVTYATMGITAFIATFYGVKSELRKRGILKAAARPDAPSAEIEALPALPAGVIVPPVPAQDTRADLRALLLETFTELRAKEAQIEKLRTEHTEAMRVENEKNADYEIKISSWSRINMETEQRHARSSQRYEARIRELEAKINDLERTDDVKPSETTDKMGAVPRSR